ncbi:terminase large subunit domain-containing protein [Larkinella sp.]|uniref:terminase large subunit domain-containing protein n=1 Tax=Larkinella sp. TaxID=2034517 RepID=UPI003BAB526D
MNTIEEELEIELMERELAGREYGEYFRYVNPGHDMLGYHNAIAEHLQRFDEGKIKKLMITMPPQTGKSEMATRNFIPYLFGRNPNRRIALLSFAASKAKKFNREIQQRLTNERYRNVFPNVNLATLKDKASTRTTEAFDIVGYAGSLKTVGRRGALTGDPVDIAVLDDLIKDYMEAQSPVIREQAWDWIDTVVDTRFHNDSQILYVTTRWDEDDPSGRFLDKDGYYSKTNPDGWVLLNFPAIKTKAVNTYDHRREGEALWPQRQSRARMLAKQKESPVTFNALYQGDPKPSEESLVFPNWIEIEEMPTCDHNFYVIDFGYTKDPTFIGHVGRSGRSLYVDEYVYETGLTNPDILDRFHAAGLNSQWQTICDKAEPKSIDELKTGTYRADGVKVSGINATPCEKGPGSIVAGIGKLNEYTVYYTRRSRNIAKETRNYKYIMANGKSTNQPIDRHNHAMDGIRSGVFTLYGKPEVTNQTRVMQAPRAVDKFGGGPSSAAHYKLR